MGSAPVLPGTRGSDPVRVSPTCAGGSSAERLGCLAAGPCGDPCGPRGLSTRPTRGRLGTRSTNPDIVIATDKCETANIASDWSAAEMRQAEYFRAILDEQHAQLSVKSPTTRRRWRTVRTPTIRAEYVDFGEGLRTNIALSAGLAVRVRRTADHRRDGRHARGRYRDGRPQTRRRSAQRSGDRGGTQAITVIAPMRDLHEEPASQSRARGPTL